MYVALLQMLLARIQERARKYISKLRSDMKGSDIDRKLVAKRMVVVENIEKLIEVILILGQIDLIGRAFYFLIQACRLPFLRSNFPSTRKLSWRAFVSKFLLHIVPNFGFLLRFGLICLARSHIQPTSLPVYPSVQRQQPPVSIRVRTTSSSSKSRENLGDLRFSLKTYPKTEAPQFEDRGGEQTSPPKKWPARSIEASADSSLPESSTAIVASKENSSEPSGCYTVFSRRTHRVEKKKMNGDNIRIEETADGSLKITRMFDLSASESEAREKQINQREKLREQKKKERQERERKLREERQGKEIEERKQQEMAKETEERKVDADQNQTVSFSFGPSVSTSVLAPLCEQFSRTGGCSKGENCLFRHVKPQEELVSISVCSEFSLNGSCPRGESCSFRHIKSRGRGLSRLAFSAISISRSSQSTSASASVPGTVSVSKLIPTRAISKSKSSSPTKPPVRKLRRRDWYADNLSVSSDSTPGLRSLIPTWLLIV